jgi:hypothetical protein
LIVWALPLLKLVGSAGELAGCTTVVVTECVVVLPLAMANAMAPPATAPPTMGSSRLRFMKWFLLASSLFGFLLPSTAGRYEKTGRNR